MDLIAEISLLEFAQHWNFHTVFSVQNARKIHSYHRGSKISAKQLDKIFTW